MTSTVVPKDRVRAQVSELLAQALSKGFQVSPDAVRLLQAAAEREHLLFSPEKNQQLPNLPSLINYIIEIKNRSAGVAAVTTTTTITKSDLVEFLPDVFGDLEQQQAQVPNSLPAGAGLFPADASKRNAPDIEVVENFSRSSEPTGTEGFALLFRSRYEKLLGIFGGRPEARQLTKISRLAAAGETSEKRRTKRVAGLVLSKRQMKNGWVELTIDDDTGKVSLIALGDGAKKVSEIALDQCAMFEVEPKQDRLFVRNVTQPDLPNRVPATSKRTAYAVFLSDLHIGSNKFLSGAFQRFVDWISGRYHFVGELDEEIIRRLEYIVIGGDIVDGVGVFPNQEYELEESDIYRQYRMVYDKIAPIPPHLKILMIPGNHDSTRQALPQPMIPEKYAGPLYGLPNLTMLSDPCVVRLRGVTTMIFHGRSLDDILATTPGLSYERPTEAMKVLLRARHLAPIFGQRTPVAPDIEDHLVISQAPDIFHAGHVHSVGVDSYKGTLMINSGTWQAQTGYQANLGIMPRPGLVPVVNLATLEVTFRDFLTSATKKA